MTQSALLIKSKKEAFTEILGNNLSKKKGEGYDFRGLREYQNGDDVKKIDWIISSKSGQIQVKEFDEERELNIIVAPMLNGSLYFGSDQSKQELAAQIAATIGYATTKNSDLISLFAYSDRVLAKTKPSKNHKAVDAIFDFIYTFDLLRHKGDYKGFAKELYTHTKRKSLIVVIGDFIGEIDFSLVAKKHELVFIVVRDRFEESPTKMKLGGFIDPSTLANIGSSLSQSDIEAYKAKIAQNDATLFAHCKKNKIRYTKIYTNTEPIVALRKVFA